MDQPVAVEKTGFGRQKFEDFRTTVDGLPRASVALDGLQTLWFNTGTICNLACPHCYIKSSPTNDSLSFITVEDVRNYLDEISLDDHGTQEIGFTGGEPFINPHLTDILDLVLSRGFRALVLTNAMKPLWKKRGDLRLLRNSYGDCLKLRVSIDHYTRRLHEEERGANSWVVAIKNLKWLALNRFALSIAGRTMWHEGEAAARAGYAALFAAIEVDLDAQDPRDLILFPEMDDTVDVPEISEGCWSLLGVSPASMMCATSRMVIRRKGEPRPVVTPCTLLPLDSRFDLGETLAEAGNPVFLNHPHCSRFCVLGGGSCSG